MLNSSDARSNFVKKAANFQRGSLVRNACHKKRHATDLLTQHGLSAESVKGPVEANASQVRLPSFVAVL